MKKRGKNLSPRNRKEQELSVKFENLLEIIARVAIYEGIH
jgi:hypothetical protein